MTIERSVEIDAQPEAIWRVMMDLARWPQWTASIQSIELLDGPSLKRGGRARVRQPKLPSAIWSITELSPAQYFEWQSTSPGITSRAGHRIEALGPNRSRVTLSLGWSGLLAPLIRLAFGSLSRRYVDMEAEGLKRTVEATAGASSSSNSLRPEGHSATHCH